MSFPRTFLLALALVVGTFLPTMASAQPAAAQRFLEQRHASLVEVLGQDAGDARDARLDELIAGLLDYEELSRRALGDHWEAQSEENRARFVTLLTELVERSYKQNLRSTMRFEVDYSGAETRGRSVIVHTSARSRENRRAPAVSIDYKMRKVGDRWRVFDVITDGASLVRNYRSQFHRIIERDGFSGLIERMEARRR